MSVESYIRALPKVELHLQLEGAVPRETMLMFADQNEIRDSVKRFDQWLNLYESPDFKKLDELSEMLQSWLRYGDDLTRAIYDIGVSMSKDNVRYAEVGVNPLSYVTNDFTFDEFINALNDGRDRAERAWGVQMRWVMLIPRHNPRRADEVARWATSAKARKGGVVGIAIVGYGKTQSLDQFERAFQTAEKKEIMRSAYLGEKDDIGEAIDQLGLQQIVDGWGLVESPETLHTMQENNVSLSVGLARAKAYGWLSDVGDYPLQSLMDSGVKLTISSDMPVLFGNNLSDEYLALLNHGLMTLEQVEDMIRQSLDVCSLDAEDKAALSAIFEVESDVLRMEHLETPEAE